MATPTLAEQWPNRRVAQLLVHIADLVEIKGEIPFKVRAYRRAAENIGNLEEPVTGLWQAGRLREVPGVGEAIARKLDELFRTGEMTFLKELEAQVPPSLRTLLELPGVGPKTARLLWEGLGIIDLDGLERAARAGRVRELPGMGERAEARLLAALAARRGGPAS